MIFFARLMGSGILVAAAFTFLAGEDQPAGAHAAAPVKQADRLPSWPYVSEAPTGERPAAARKNVRLITGDHAAGAQPALRPAL